VHPWSAFIVLPLFAFANARIEVSGDAITDAATSPVSLGIIAGLVVGKPVGIVAATWLATRLNLGSLPHGVTMKHVIGGGALGGIGFTVALFITGLAYTDTDLITQAKMGITAASLLAALIGIAILRTTNTPTTPQHPDDNSGQ
jgi:Na+/H+ antiporter NhaA